ncbi:hypothetical protein L7F22_020311 [Adiantum nelumboides]|nr:hypothetical protein [Adiantum nelumboides]
MERAVGDHGFTCAICLGGAERDAVVTACGHLFCWPCLRAWLLPQPRPAATLNSTFCAAARRCPSCRNPQVLPLVALALKTPPPPPEHVQHQLELMPDFSCSRCLKPHALQPVALRDCGHVYCWRCLHPLIIRAPAASKCCVSGCSSLAVPPVPLFIADDDDAKSSAAAAAASCHPTSQLPSRKTLLSASMSMPAFRGRLSGDLMAAIGDSCVAAARVRYSFLRYFSHYERPRRPRQLFHQPVHRTGAQSS